MTRKPTPKTLRCSCVDCPDTATPVLEVIEKRTGRRLALLCAKCKADDDRRWDRMRKNNSPLVALIERRAV